MEMITQTLMQTPWWVYVLLVYLTIAGVKASKPQVIPLKKLFIIPAVFTFMSIHTLLTSVALNYFNVTSWVIAILIGGGLGWWQIYRFFTSTDANL